MMRRLAPSLTLVALLTAPPWARPLSEEDLARYGYGTELGRSVSTLNTHHAAPRRKTPSERVPPAIIPAGIDSAAAEAIPAPPPGRLFSQVRGKAPPVEGPTRIYRGSDGRELAGTFREVENFFLRPGHHYPRFLSMNEHGVTGLIQTMTAEVERTGTQHLRFGFAHTAFRRSFGQALIPGQRIEQNLFPFTLMVVPTRDVEASLSATIVDEQARRFPLVRDFDQAGLRDVTGQAKYRFVDNPGRRVGVAFLFGIRAGIERDVTRVGSSGVDYFVQAAATRRIHNFGVHVDGGLIFANGQDRTNAKVPDIGFADLGLDFQPSDHIDFILELNYLDFKDVGSNLETTVGLKWRMSDKWRYDLGVPIALRNHLAQGYTSRVTTGFQFRF